MSDADAPPAALALRGITKRFGAVTACHRVDLELRGGEIHALLGENGAGKSTLMNVAYGLYAPDAGTIALDGRAVQFRSPGEALAAGLGMVHQHFMLVPTLTALENAILGAEPTLPRRLTRLMGRIDWASARARFRDLCDHFAFDLAPDRLVRDMTVGEEQRLEILKTLYRGARIILLDEPTAVLTPQEAARLFELVARLAAEGVAVLLTSHKLEEVIASAQRFSVMRDGELVGHGDVAGTTRADLVRMMVGRTIDLDARDDHAPPAGGPTVLRLADVATGEGAGRPLRGVSLEVRAGEILGIAGVDGNGQAALEAALTGWIPAERGSIELLGAPLDGLGTLERLARGLAFIPGDRHRDGLVLDFTVHENLLLGYTDRRLRRWRGGPMGREARAWTRDLVTRFDIQPPLPDIAARGLSGGNQQKAVVARALAAESPALLAVNPTRGVDVGAIEYIHGQLRARRDAGAAILLVSTELGELLALCDRIQVLHRGELTPPMPAAGADPLELGRLMTCGADEPEGAEATAAAHG